MSNIILGSELFIGASAIFLNALAGEEIFPLYLPNLDIILRPASGKECLIYFRSDIEKEFVEVLAPEIRAHLDSHGTSAPPPLRTSFRRLQSLLPDIDTQMSMDMVYPFTSLEIYLSLPGLNPDIELRIPCMKGGDFSNTALLTENIDGAVWLSSLQSPLKSIEKDNIRDLIDSTGCPVDLVLLDTGTLPREEIKSALNYTETGLHHLDPNARIVICNPSEALDAQAFGYTFKLETSGIQAVRNLINTISERPDQKSSPKEKSPSNEPDPSNEKKITPENPLADIPASLVAIKDLPLTLANLETVKNFYEDLDTRVLPEYAEEISGIIREFVKNINSEDISLHQPSRQYADFVAEHLPEWLKNHSLKHRNSFSLMMAGGSKIFGKEACEDMQRHEKELIKKRDSIFLPVIKKRFSAILDGIVPELERAIDTLNAWQKWLLDSQPGVISQLDEIRTWGDEKKILEELMPLSLFNVESAKRMGKATSAVEYNQKNPVSHEQVLDAIRTSAKKEISEFYYELGNAYRWKFISQLKITLAQFDNHFKSLCRTMAAKAGSEGRSIDPAIKIVKHLSTKL